MSERQPPRPDDTPDPNMRQQGAPMPGDQQLEDPAMRTLAGGPTAPLKERQPGGLFLLFIVEMWERFSYYGMRALLVLFMVDQVMNGGMGWTDQQAGKLYGWYTSLVYLTPVFGGMLADKLLGTHRSMVIGGIIIALGHFALAGMDIAGAGTAGHDLAFYGGLGLIILGTGFFKPCVSVMVGQLYRQGDPRRDSGFTIFYMGINVGAFLGALACGWLAKQWGWSWGFGAAGVGMVAGLLAYFVGRPKLLRGIGLPPENPEPVVPVLAKVFGLIGAVALFGGIYVFLNSRGGNTETAAAAAETTRNIWPMIANIYAAVLALAILGGLVWFVRSQKQEDRGPMAALFIICFFVIFFWYAFEQAGSSMNVFAERRVDLRWLGGREFPAAWFQSVNPFYILVFAPILAILWRFLGRRRLEPNTPTKMSFGLILLGLGFVLMVMAAFRSDGGEYLPVGTEPAMRVAPYWLLGAYLLHTIGELMLSPIGLSLVTKLAAKQWVSLMMGVWFLSPAIAQLIGGYTFAFNESIQQKGVPPDAFGGQADFFLLFVITSIGAGLVMLAISPLLKKLMHGRV